MGAAITISVSSGLPLVENGLTTAVRWAPIVGYFYFHVSLVYSGIFVTINITTSLLIYGLGRGEIGVLLATASLVLLPFWTGNLGRTSPSKTFNLRSFSQVSHIQASVFQVELPKWRIINPRIPNATSLMSHFFKKADTYPSPLGLSLTCSDRIQIS